ncbi:MAG TPA: hypothetical protein VMW55_03830 [Nitrosopumilaceae archaeon]|nr:hypothetical protein [Nitrosopumilaceae archaeon]
MIKTIAYIFGAIFLGIIVTSFLFQSPAVESQLSPGYIAFRDDIREDFGNNKVSDRAELRSGWFGDTSLESDILKLDRTGMVLLDECLDASILKTFQMCAEGLTKGKEVLCEAGYTSLDFCTTPKYKIFWDRFEAFNNT